MRVVGIGWVGIGLVISFLSFVPKGAYGLGNESSFARSIAPDFVDPEARTRMHITPRGSLSFGNALFTNYSIWSLDLDGTLQVTPGFGVSLGLPVALESPVELPVRFVIGNIPVGVRFGHVIRLSDTGAFRDGSPMIGLGGAVDYYIPSAQRHDPEAPCAGRRPISTCDSVASARMLHTFDPGRFVAQATGFRARAHADLGFKGLWLQAETGLTSMWTFQGASKNLMWLTLTGRASIRATGEIEPFLEAGADFQINGDPVPRAPTILTAGCRFHLIETVSPAVFVSLSLWTGGLIFGVDLAGVIIPTFESDRHTKDTDNFLDIEEPAEWN